MCHTDPLSHIWHSSIKSSWRYKAKSLDHEIYVTDQHIFYEVNLCTILIHYPKHNVTTANSLQDIKLSLTYIYFMRSIFVSHWCIIPNMTFIHQMTLKILSKITGPWNIDQRPTYILWSKSCISSMTYNTKSLNHEIWVTVTYIYFEVKGCITLTHYPNTSIHQIVFKILSKITQPWGHRLSPHGTKAQVIWMSDLWYDIVRGDKH